MSIFGTRRSKSVLDPTNVPPAHDWSTFGGHQQIVPNESGTGFETPGRFSDTSQADGRNFGAARIDPAEALGADAAPNRFVTGGVGVRKGVVKQNTFRASLSAGQRSATADSRIAEAKERFRVLGQRLMRLEEKLLPAARAQVEACQAKVEQFKATFEQKKAEYLALERTLRGYFDSHRAVLFVGIAVVLFDGAVLHGILEYSGMTLLTVWLTSLTVPLAIGAANHGFGVLAGAIGLRVPSEKRLRLGAVLFVAGMGSLVVAFLLLTVFRVTAADAQNEALRALAAGDAGAQLTFFISPAWLGPLQLAGSFAAITMTGLWTMAKQGREFRALVVEPAEVDWREAESTLKEAELVHHSVEQRIEQTHQELETAALVEHQIDADRHAATVELDTAEDVLAASLESEDSLETAMQARYEATEQYFEQIYRNGGVWRMAMATVFPRVGRPYTPGATDTAADEDEISKRRSQREPRRRGVFRRGSKVVQPGSNGQSDHPIDLDHLTKF